MSLGEPPPPNSLPDPLEARLVVSPPSTSPGKSFYALLHVHCTGAVSQAALHSLSVELQGLERVDSGWVKPSYRRSTPAVSADRRRTRRLVARGSLQATCQAEASPTPSTRRFIIRSALPSGLPPSFRGTAVRVWYAVQVTLRYAVRPIGAQVEGSAGIADVASSILPSGPMQTLTVRVPLTVAPCAADCAQSPFKPLSGPLPVDVRCWEVGGGTLLRDAVAHVEGAREGDAGEASPSRAEVARVLGALAGACEGVEVAGADLSSARLTPRRLALRDAGGQADGGGERALDPGALSPQVPSPPTLLLPAPTTRSYALRCGATPLARLVLHCPPDSTRFVPGSLVAGTLEFARSAGDAPSSPPPLRCWQVSVALEREERVAAPFATHAGSVRAVEDETGLACAYARSWSFELALPRDAPPSFATPLLSLAWSLRLSLLVSRAGAKKTPGNVALAPSPGDVEELSWTLPVEVHGGL